MHPNPLCRPLLLPNPAPASECIRIHGFGAGAVDLEAELRRLVLDGHECDVIFDEFPYYLSDQTREVLISVAFVHLKNAELSKHIRNLSAASRAILLSGPTEPYLQSLVKALSHYFKARLLIVDATDFSLRVQSKYGGSTKATVRMQREPDSEAGFGCVWNLFQLGCRIRMLGLLVLQFAKDEGIPLGGQDTAQVLLGRDTRPTGAYLLDVALQGINAIVGARGVDMGILTTPQLHWMVRSKNKGVKASESDYFTQLIRSFRRMLELVPKDKSGDDVAKKLIVDGANGIGGVEQMTSESYVLNLVYLSVVW